jgi:hypothetical protein
MLHREVTMPRARVAPVMWNTTHPWATTWICIAAVKKNIARRKRRKSRMRKDSMIRER